MQYIIREIRGGDFTSPIRDFTPVSSRCWSRDGKRLSYLFIARLRYLLVYDPTRGVEYKFSRLIYSVCKKKTRIYDLAYDKTAGVMLEICTYVLIITLCQYI